MWSVKRDIYAQVFTGQDLYIHDLRVTDSAYIGGTLYAGSISYTSTTVSGIFTSTNTTNAISTITGAITTSGGIGVAKDVYIGGNITVETTSNLVTTNISGQLSSVYTVDSTTPTTGSIVTAGGLGVTKTIVAGGTIKTTAVTPSTSTTTGSIIAGGGAGIAGDLNVGGVITTTDTTPSTSTTTGAVVIAGGLGVAGNISTGSFSTSGPLVVTDATSSTSSVTGCIIGAGGLGIAENINAGGYIKTTNTTASSSPTTGSIIAGGGLGVAGAINSAGAIKTTNVTASTSPTTGSIIAGGGLGVAGAINSGGVIKTTNTTASTSTTTGSIVTAGGLGVAGAIYTDSINTNSLSTSGPLVTTDTTSSTSTTTGSIIGAGGLGIAENINAGGYIKTTDTTASTSTTTGSVVTAGGLGVAGSAYFGGGVNVSGVLQATKVGVNSTVDADTPFQLVHNGYTAKIRDNGDGILMTASTGSFGISASPAGNYGGGSSSCGVKLISGTTQIYQNGVVRLQVNGLGCTSNVPLSVTSANVSSSTTTGAVMVTGGVGVGGAINAGGAIKTTDATLSTSTTTGSIVAGGGLGVVGDAYINAVHTDNIYENTTNAGVTIDGVVVKDGMITCSNSSTTSNALTNIFKRGAGATGWVAGAFGPASGTQYVVLGWSASNGPTIAAYNSDFSTFTTLRIGHTNPGSYSRIDSGDGMLVSNTIDVTDINTAGTVFNCGVAIQKKLLTASTITTTDTTASTTTATGSIVTAGGVGVGGAINAGGAITTSDATASTSTTTGALIITGGAGIGGDLYLGGSLETSTIVQQVETITSNVGITLSATIHYSIIKIDTTVETVYRDYIPFEHQTINFTLPVPASDGVEKTIILDEGADYYADIRTNIAGKSFPWVRTFVLTPTERVLKLRYNATQGAWEQKQGPNDISKYWLNINPDITASNSSRRIIFNTDGTRMVFQDGTGWVTLRYFKRVNHDMTDIQSTDITPYLTMTNGLSNIAITLSEDGGTLVIGNRGDGATETGECLVFLYNSGTDTYDFTYTFAPSVDIANAKYVAISADGTTLASVSDTNLYVHTIGAVSATLVTTFAQGTSVNFLKISGDGNFIVSGYNGTTIKVYQRVSSVWSDIQTIAQSESSDACIDYYGYVIVTCNRTSGGGAGALYNYLRLPDQATFTYQNVAKAGEGINTYLGYPGSTGMSSDGLKIFYRDRYRFGELTRNSIQEPFVLSAWCVNYATDWSSALYALCGISPQGNMEYLFKNDSLGTANIMRIFLAPSTTGNDSLVDYGVTGNRTVLKADGYVRALEVTKTLDVGGVITTTDTTASTTTSTGSIIAGGGVGVAGAINSGGAIKTTDATASTTTATGSIIAGGGVGVAGAVNAGGYIKTTDATASTSTTTGSIITAGGLGVAGAINSGSISSSGPLVTTDTTSSTSTTTGSIIGAGGLGIAENVNAGGYIKTTDTTASTSTTTGSIITAGGIGVAGTINAGKLGIGMNPDADAGFQLKLGAYDLKMKSNGDGVVIGATNGNSIGIATSPTYNYGNVGSAGIKLTPSTMTISLNNSNRATFTDTAFTITPPLTVSATTASTTTSTGSIIAGGGVGIAGAVNAGGAIKTTATTASTSTTTGSIIAGGGVGIAGDINIGGAVNAGGAITTTDVTASTTTSTGSIIAGGGVGVAGAVNAGGAIKTTDTTASTTTTTGSIIAGGGVGVAGAINSGGAIKTTDITASTSTTTGSIIAGGGLGVAGAIYADSINTNSFSAGGPLVTTDTTSSTSTITGSIIGAGGLGIAENINAGGYIKTTNATASTSTTTGSIIAGGGLGVAGAINIGGAVNAGGAITTTDTTASTTTATGSIIAGGGVGVAGAVNAGGVIKTTDNTASTTTTTGSIIAGGGVGVAGAINSGGAITTTDTTASTSTSTGSGIFGGGLGVAGTINAGGLSFDGTNVLSNYTARTAYTPTLSTFTNLTGTPSVTLGFYERIGSVVYFAFTVSNLNITSTGVKTQFRFNTPTPAIASISMTTGTGRCLNIANTVFNVVVCSDWTGGDPSYAGATWVTSFTGACYIQLSGWYWGN